MCVSKTKADRCVVLCVLQKSVLIQSRLGGINQRTLTATRLLSTDKPPKGQAPPHPITYCCCWHGKHNKRPRVSSNSFELTSVFWFLCLKVLRSFSQRLKRALESTKQLKVTTVAYFIQSLPLYPCHQCLACVYLQCFSSCTLEINTKEQEAFVRKEQDGKERNGDDGRGGRGGDKEDWQWWTRLQVPNLLVTL